MSLDSVDLQVPTSAEVFILRSRLLSLLGGDLRLLDLTRVSDTVFVAHHNRLLTVEELQLVRTLSFQLHSHCVANNLHPSWYIGGLPNNPWVFCTHCLVGCESSIASSQHPHRYRSAVQHYCRRTGSFPIVHRHP